MPTAGEDLQELVKSWAAENPEVRTISYLARKSGIDYNTISRAWAGKNPECQTALAILYVVCSKEMALAFLKQHFPTAARFHEKELSIPVFADSEVLSPMFQDSMKFTLLCLAYSGQGKREYIQKRYGGHGIAVAEELVGSARLQWIDGSLVPKGPEEFFTFSAKTDVSSACETIAKLSRGSGGYPVALIGNLNDDEHEKFKGILREFCHATKELVYSSKGGDNVVTLATVYVNLSGEVKS